MIWSYESLGIEELEELLGNKNLIFIFGKIGDPTPGVLLFSTKLEFCHFPPRSEKGKDLSCDILYWEGMEWVVLSIPKGYMDLAKKLAKETGLRISEGGPHMVIEKKSVSFPIESSNLFTLERIPRQINEELKNYKEIIGEEIEKIKSIERDFLLKNEGKPVKIIWDEN